MKGIFAAILLSSLVCAPAAGGELEEANGEADRVHSNGKTALMLAAKRGDNQQIRGLLAKGADVNRPNRNGGTAIMYAALSGQPATVLLLLEHGARPDAVAANGWTALMIASVKGYEEVVGLLLAHGAEPNHPDVYAWTPLMRAAQAKRLRVARALLDDDETDVNRRGENGVTALHIAVAAGDANIVKLLLEHGADPSAEDRSGRTALDFARQSDDPVLIGLMNAEHRD